MKVSPGLLFLLLASCTTPSIIATQSIQKGDAANNQNNYPEAIKNYEQYLVIAPQLGLYRNLHMEGDVLRKLAHAYSTQGQYKESIKQLKKALNIDSVNTHTLQFFEDYRQLGLVYGYSGEFNISRTYLQKSLSLNEGLEKSQKESKRTAAADTYLALAQLELSLGNYKEAREWAWKGLDIYSKIPGGDAGSIESTLIIGIIERERGQLDQAERFIKQSRDISQANKLGTGRHAQAFSEIYFLKGDPENGIRFMLQAVEEAEKANIKPQIINAYMRLGDGYQRMGDKGKANFYYRKAMTFQKEMAGDTVGFVPSLDLRVGNAKKVYDYYLTSGSTTGLASVSLRLGEQYFQKGDMDSALFMYDQAKIAFSKSGSVEGISTSSFESAKIYIAKNQFAEAEKFLHQSMSLTNQKNLKWQIFLSKGIIKEKARGYDSALLYYKESVNLINEMRGNISIEEFKTLFSNNKVEVYDGLILLLLQHYKDLSGYSYDKAVTESFEFSEQSRSRAFLDMLGNRKIEAKSTKDEDLLEKEQLLKLKIQQLSREINKATPYSTTWIQFSNELQKAEADYDILVREIKLNNSAYSTVMSVEPPRITDIQSKLDDETAVVEYWMSDEALVIWTITQAKVTATLSPIHQKDLKRLVRGYRNTIMLEEFDVVANIRKSLSQFLIRPLEPLLAGHKKLIIIPHKDLHFLPFHALEYTDKKYLVEQFIVSYAPSASVLHYCLNKTAASGTKILSMALGNLTIGGFAGLPGTELEINQLAELYPQMEFKIKEDFSETYLKQKATGQNYIHLATHGVLNKAQPLYSYLLMNPTEADDGRLTVDEIFSMNLQTKFVTLSACETGLGDIGDGDDLVGLSRAFIYAGSPGVIVSLWKVDDETTALLMARFHQYITNGYNTSESLTYAQRDLIRQSFTPESNSGVKIINLTPSLQTIASKNSKIRSESPYYWAPFIIIGNGFVK
jgi:CHAT domain-containing protein/Flp pilus assembly protein TadD